MQYELYIDVFAISNFCMDFLALFLTNAFLGRNCPVKTLFFPSLIGTVSAILLFLFLPDYSLYTLIIHFLVNPAMVYFSFRENNRRRFLEDWGVTYLVVLLAGGAMQWICQTLFAGKYFLLSVFLTLVIGFCAVFVWERKATVGKRIYEVKLFLAGREYPMRAYYDTGNLLMDPYFHEPVSITASPKIREAVRELPGRLIVYSSLGEQNGLIWVYTMERMLIYKKKSVVMVEPAVIGIADEKLSLQGDYQMILNGKLL